MQTTNGVFTAWIQQDGVPLHEYWIRGVCYVASKPYLDFTICVGNNSGIAIEVLSSIYGLSVTTGKPSTRQDPAQRVEPYRTVEISGWTFCKDKTLPFQFGKLPDEYVSQMGAPSNMGVASVCVFCQQPPKSLSNQSPGINRSRAAAAFILQFVPADKIWAMGANPDSRMHVEVPLILPDNGVSLRGIQRSQGSSLPSSRERQSRVPYGTLHS